MQMKQQLRVNGFNEKFIEKVEWASIARSFLKNLKYKYQN